MSTTPDAPTERTIESLVDDVLADERQSRRLVRAAVETTLALHPATEWDSDPQYDLAEQAYSCVMTVMVAQGVTIREALELGEMDPGDYELREEQARQIVEQDPTSTALPRYSIDTGDPAQVAVLDQVVTD